MSNPPSNDIFMRIHISENESKFQKFQKQLKKSLFYLIFLLSKDTDSNLFFQSIILIIQYIQIMYFPFYSYVKIFLYKIFLVCY